MHSSHEIGHPSAGTLTSSTGKIFNHSSSISASVAEESFSRVLASAITHTATMTGSAAQYASTPGEELHQRPLTAIVAGAHGGGDKTADADFQSSLIEAQASMIEASQAWQPMAP
jgi:hypothetical protein